MGKEQRRPISRLAKPVRPLVPVLLLCLVAAESGAQTRAILHRAPAEYPTLAEKMHISGTVTVVASVEPSGNVSAARAITGHAMLRPAAEKAVMHWKFASAPKPEDTTIDIQFELRGEGTR